MLYGIMTLAPQGGNLQTITSIMVLLSKIAGEINHIDLGMISTGATLMWLVTGPFPEAVRAHQTRVPSLPPFPRCIGGSGMHYMLLVPGLLLSVRATDAACCVLETPSNEF